MDFLGWQIGFEFAELMLLPVALNWNTVFSLAVAALISLGISIVAQVGIAPTKTPSKIHYMLAIFFVEDQRSHPICGLSKFIQLHRSDNSFCSALIIHILPIIRARPCLTHRPILKARP
jgi:hypothetical protein